MQYNGKKFTDISQYDTDKAFSHLFISERAMLDCAEIMDAIDAPVCTILGGLIYGIKDILHKIEEGEPDVKPQFNFIFPKNERGIVKGEINVMFAMWSTLPINGVDDTGVFIFLPEEA